MNRKSSASRRKFIKTSASMAASLAVLPDAMDVSFGNHVFSTHPETMATQKSLIGTYGEWAASLVKNIPAF